MKHNIRQHLINEFGQKVVKIKQIHGELGSGILDKNGKEIFEGDIVTFDNGELAPLKSRVEFDNGGFYASDWNGYLSLTQCTNLEVVGHAGD